MKRLLFTISLGVCFSGYGQDCSGYYFLQDNKTIEMTIYNKKGNPNGKQIYTVSDVSNGGGEATATLNSEMFDKKGKSIVKSNSTIKCKDGVMMVDMKMNMPQQQSAQFSKADAKAENIYIEYPNNMAVGDKLKDGKMDMDIDNNGMKQSINMVISDRNVEGKEAVTTSAGTWECFKISYKMKMNIRTMGIGMPMSIEGTEWYAPGFGVVKTESKQGSTAITAIN
jgi:hypothetical protein